MFTPPLQRAPQSGQYTAPEEQFRGQRTGHGHSHGHPAPPAHTDPWSQGHRLPPSPVVSQTQLYSGERICRLPKRTRGVYVFFDGYGPIVYTGPAVHRASTGRRGRYIHECKILHCIMRVNISPNFATLSCNLGMFLHVYCPKNLFMLSKHLSQFLVVLQTRMPPVQFYERNFYLFICLY